MLKMFRPVVLALGTGALALGLPVGSAEAASHHGMHKVCEVHWRHHHKVKECHWVRDMHKKRPHAMMRHEMHREMHKDMMKPKHS